MIVFHCYSPIRPSPLHEQFQWPSNPNRPNFPFTLTLYNTHPCILTTTRVLQQGAEVAPRVLSPGPVINADEGKEELPGPVNGVAGTASEDKTSVSSTRVKKKRQEEDGFDDRFKLRNGREVYEEKAFLVGDERKGDAVDSFSIEESLKELSQLADTAGLMVVGSTCQKLASLNQELILDLVRLQKLRVQHMPWILRV